MKRIIVNFFIIVLLFSLGFLGSYAYQVYTNSTSENSVISPFISFLAGGKFMVYGFQPYWLVAKADPSYPDLLTHLGYFGLSVSADGSLVTYDNPGEYNPGWAMLENSAYQKTLADFRKDGKTLSLVVHTMDDDVIFPLLENPEQSAEKLTSEAIPIMKKYGFTDLNIDIESFTEASEESRLRYTTFITKIREAVYREKAGTLSMDIIAKSAFTPLVNDLSALSSIVDRFIIMTYDFHYSGSNIAGPVAPVGGEGERSEFDIRRAITETLKVIPHNKLVLGIPLYGYEWETISARPGSAVIPKTGQTASNRRVEELLSDCPSCVTGFDDVTLSPYVIYEDEASHYQQLFYENAESLGRKVALAREFNLAGVAYWALGYEGDKLRSAMKSVR